MFSRFLAPAPAMLALFLAGLTPPSSLSADTISLHPVADTTLIEGAPGGNLGGATFLNAGTSGTGVRNRGLIQFALSESIPMGSVITSVSLSLEIVRQPGEGLQIAAFALHRLLSSWGEGDKVPGSNESPGQGSPATAGEATWLSRFLGGPLWGTPGGQAGVDFETQPSATTTVLQIGDPVDFVSTTEMTADLQRWLDHPESNHGWMLMPLDETITRSARSFASRENDTGGPTLTIAFTPVPEPTTLAIAGLACLLLVHRCRNRGRRASPDAKCGIPNAAR